MKNRPVIVATAFTLTSALAFALWKFIPWRIVGSKLSALSISDLPPFWYYAIIVGAAVTIMAVIWRVLQVVPKRQARAIYKPESPIVMGERKITVDGFTSSPQPAIKPTELFSIENEARKTLSQIIGGFVVIIGLLFTGANLAITQRQAAINQQEAEKNRSLALEGQITDRFTRAIAQLGDKEKLEVRLGGIYALERIAKDSEKDHWTIMEVLTAYVREHAHNPPVKQKGKKENTRLSTDIQAILTVIGRRGSNVEKNRIDLSNTFLSSANLREANLRGAYLGITNLSGANLDKSDLTRADLGEAILYKALLGTAALVGAYLRKANLKEATLFRADLGGTFLRDADLRGADFTGANLVLADLRGADLRGANLREAKRLTWEQLAETIMDEKTQLPPELEEKHKDEIKKLIETPRHLRQ